MPTSSSAWSSKRPAGPTNGRPSRSSRSPGCSPMKRIGAPGLPSPKTVCVPVSWRGQAVQPAAASLSFGREGRSGTSGAAVSTTISRLTPGQGGKPLRPVPTLPDLRPNTGFVARASGRTVVLLRWLIVPAWIAVAAVAFVELPGIGGLESAPLSGLVPGDSPAMQAQARSQRLFRVPIVSGLAVVVRKEGGYSLGEQEKILSFAAQARRTDRAVVAVPVINTLGLVPGSRERNTTAITYLIPPGDDPIELVADAEDYAKRLGALLPGSFTGVTGTLAARDAESDAINSSLPWIELGTVLLIFSVLAFSFRSLGAPLVTLFAAGISFVIAERAVTWVANRFELSVPREVEPLMLVLVLAVVTDYAVFFLAG